MSRKALHMKPSMLLHKNKPPVQSYSTSKFSATSKANAEVSRCHMVISKSHQKSFLKRSLSEGSFKKMEMYETSRRKRKRKASSKQLRTKRRKKLKSIKSKIERIRRIYDGHKAKLKMIIKKQHKLYEKCIKSISQKVRHIEKQFRVLTHKIDDLRYRNKHYFHFEDVKSLGFLLNNSRYNNPKFRGSELYFKINQIVNQNKQLKTEILADRSDTFLGVSDPIPLHSESGAAHWGGLVDPNGSEEGLVESTGGSRAMAALRSIEGSLDSLSKLYNKEMIQELKNICGPRKFNGINEQELDISSKKAFKDKAKCFFQKAVNSDWSELEKRWGLQAPNRPISDTRADCAGQTRRPGGRARRVGD